MAFQSIDGHLYFPGNFTYRGSFSTYSAFGPIDAVGEKIAYVFRAPKTGTLAKVAFRTATITTGGTLRLSFQNIGADGFPDGTQDQFFDQTILDTDDAVAFLSGPLTDDGTGVGVKRAVTKGDLVAVVFELTGAGAMNLGIDQTGLSRDNFGTYSAINQGTWAKSTNMPTFAVEYDDETYAFIAGASPFTNGLASNSFNSGSTPDEHANIITVPFSMKVVGLYAVVQQTLSGSDWDLILYDTDGTSVLASTSHDADQSSINNLVRWVDLFATPLTLAAGDYRVAVKPTTANSVQFPSGTVNKQQARAQLSSGLKVKSSSRTDAGTWTDDDTVLHVAGLVLADLSDNAGGSGGSGSLSKMNAGLN